MVQSYMEDLQRLASKAANAPWPAEGARCHVRVRHDVITVWWTPRYSRKRLVELQPIVVDAISDYVS
jgi:hypothetical protein